MNETVWPFCHKLPGRCQIGTPSVDDFDLSGDTTLEIDVGYSWQELRIAFRRRLDRHRGRVCDNIRAISYLGQISCSHS